MKKLSNLLLYPFLFSVYPFVSLLGSNIREVQLAETWHMFAFSLLFGTLVLLIAKAFVKNWNIAGVITAIVTVSFFSYGHVYDILGNAGQLGHHRILLPFYLILTGLGIFGVLKGSTKAIHSTPMLNLIGVVLVVMPIIQIGGFGVDYFLTNQTNQSDTPAQVGGGDSEKPDIYYMILDGYGRNDVLLNRFGFDNKPFLDKLTERGFYVATCASSNYGHTRQSVGSSLHMNYLQAVFNYTGSVPTWKNTEAIRDLRNQGYKIVAFNNGLPEILDLESDVLISRPDTQLNPFDALFLNTTMYSAVTDLSSIYPGLLGMDPEYQTYLWRYKDDRYFLDELPRIPTSIKGPKFVYFHIVAPHSPYVIGADGSFAFKELGNGYVNQAMYLDSRLPDIIDSIIANSTIPPVIIMQGDHGPPVQGEITVGDRLSILNAYYMPGHNQNLYNKISPVNTFRIVFNSYLGYHYPLLPDIRYYTAKQGLKDALTAQPSFEENPACK